MRKRIISAVIGISAIIAVIVLSLWLPISIDIFLSCACALAVYEFVKAIKTIGLYQISVLSIAFSFLYPMLAFYGAGTIICYVYTGLMLAMMVFFHSKILFKNFAYTYSMTLIITLSLSCVIQMKDADPAHSTFYFVMSLALPWLADAGGYFVGSFFGKHKLCPNISPKKTVEGAIGGVVVCILATLGFALVFDLWIYGDKVSVNYINMAIIAAAGSILSILGDLSFSVIKRSYKVKDYGDIIPGHGGILDRVDSIICFAPFFCVIIGFLPVIIIK